MASKIYSYYLTAGEIGGVKARTKLSVLTKITSIQASSIPDSEENIALFENAMKQIVKEFEGGSTIANSIPLASSIAQSTGDMTNVLRKQLNTFSDLIAQRSLFINDLESTAKRITESIVENINVERTSIWLYDEERTMIECTDLYIRSSNEHQNGFKLMAKDFPRYFASIQSERTLAANDVHTDPRTNEFSESYLKPLGITSMLDVPIWANGKMVGVVCQEHVGPARKWTTDEESFAYLMANIVAMNIEAKKAKRTELIFG